MIVDVRPETPAEADARRNDRSLVATIVIPDLTDHLHHEWPSLMDGDRLTVVSESADDDDLCIWAHEMIGDLERRPFADLPPIYDVLCGFDALLGDLLELHERLVAWVDAGCPDEVPA